MCEHGTGAELELVRRSVPHRDAEHIRRKEVGRELDAIRRGRDRARQRLGEGRLADARDILDEEVTFGEEADEGERDLLALALDHALDVVQQRLEELGDLREVGSLRATSRGGLDQETLL